MKTQISSILSLVLAIFYSSLLFSQSPYHPNKYNDPFTINDYLIYEDHSKPTTDFIRLDSLITTKVQYTSGKILFQYNNNNKISEYLSSGSYGSGYDTSYKFIRYYDSQNNLTTELGLDWNNTKWDSSSRNIYSYKTGMLSQSVFQVYNNSWENLSRYNYIYDQEQNLSTVLIESWVNNNWQNKYLITYYYSLQNKKDSIIFQMWENNDWQNTNKTIYYYSENQIDLDSIVAKSWNGLSWINFLKREILNDANHNQIEEIEKKWVFGQWLNSIRRFFTYNEFNLVESVRCELWQNNRWLTGDGDIIFKYTDRFTIGFLLTNQISAYYSNIVGIDENENTGIADYSLSQNYPNPFNPSTQIEYQIPEANFVEIKVYDLLGKETAALVNEYKSKGIYQVQFNTNDLPSGVYIYRMKAGNFSESRKMILMR